MDLYIHVIVTILCLVLHSNIILIKGFICFDSAIYIDHSDIYSNHLFTPSSHVE